MFCPIPLLATFGWRNILFIWPWDPLENSHQDSDFCSSSFKAQYMSVNLWAPWRVCWRWCYSLRVQTVFSACMASRSVSHWGLVMQAVCILLEKTDCCENLCHRNRSKGLGLSDAIPSNFSLITSGTPLHQFRHVTGKKYQLRDHLVKNEEYFPAWWMAKQQNAPGTSALFPNSCRIHRLASFDPASQRWVCLGGSWSDPHLRSYAFWSSLRGFCVSGVNLKITVALWQT